MVTLIGFGNHMKNKSLIKDYLTRATHRLAATELLMTRRSYPDVVRESQELVELCLKSILRANNIEVPRLHDVSDLLLQYKQNLSSDLKPHVSQLVKISRYLRRDRELAFYGSEDLTPSEFYREEDAKEALEYARWVLSVCQPLLK